MRRRLTSSFRTVFAANPSASSFATKPFDYPGRRHTSGKSTPTSRSALNACRLAHNVGDARRWEPPTYGGSRFPHREGERGERHGNLVREPAWELAGTAETEAGNRSGTASRILGSPEGSFGDDSGTFSLAREALLNQVSDGCVEVLTPAGNRSDNACSSEWCRLLCL